MIETIFFQIREVPNDFFVDIVSSHNFLVTILNQLFGFVRNNATVDAALRSRMEKFQVRGSCKHYVDQILALFYHLTSPS